MGRVETERLRSPDGRRTAIVEVGNRPKGFEDWTVESEPQEDSSQAAPQEPAEPSSESEGGSEPSAEFIAMVGAENWANLLANFGDVRAIAQAKLDKLASVLECDKPAARRVLHAAQREAQG